jgi:hypothetical protein
VARCYSHLLQSMINFAKISWCPFCPPSLNRKGLIIRVAAIPAILLYLPTLDMLYSHDQLHRRNKTQDVLVRSTFAAMRQ